MNAAAKVLEKMLPNPEGLDTTAGANPANDEKLADTASGEKMKVSLYTFRSDFNQAYLRSYDGV